MTEKIEFNEETVIAEVTEFLKEDEVTKEDIEINEVTQWDSIDYFHVEVDGCEYDIFESVESAEKLAKEVVTQDLETEKENFNQDWLNGLMNQRIPEGQTFLEFAAQDAIDTDGFEHFLNHYDGESDETKNGFVIMRVN